MSRHCQHVPGSVTSPRENKTDLQASLVCVSFHPRAAFVESCCVFLASSCIKVRHRQPAQRAEHLPHEDLGDSCVPKCHTALCRAQCWAVVLLDVFLLDIRALGQMFRADRVSGAVMNMHGVLAVLCSLAGICKLVFWELQACW